MKRPTTVFAALAAAVVLTATGCAGPEPTAPAPAESGDATDIDALYQAALEEGTVVWYSSTNENGFLDDFRAAYPGIEVQFLKLLSDEISTRFAQEQDANTPTADVIVNGSTEFLEDGEDRGWFAPMSDVPASDDYPADYLDEHWVTLATSPVGIAYNTDLVKPADVPETWEDALDPQFSTIYMSDIRQSQLYRSTAYMWAEEYGMEFLEELADRDLQITSGALPGLQAVAGGGAPLTLSATQTFVQSLRADGAPLDFVLPTPFVGGVFYGMVVEGAEHPNAAKLLLHFLMTQEGQEHFAAYMASPLGTFGTSITIPDGQREYDASTVLAAEPELVEALGLQ